MAARAFDLSNYKNLLSEAHPTVPSTEEENERLLGLVSNLTDKGDLSPEETAFLEVLLALIQRFEDRHYSTKRAAPHEVLLEMMSARNLEAKDLYDVFGSKGTTSEVLRGKRAISRKAAKVLAERFNVSAVRFL